MTKQRIAFCRVSDVEPLYSILPMLNAAGYGCVLPNYALREQLRRMGCKNVDEPSAMRESWGAEAMPVLPEIGPDDVPGCDIMVDVNGCRNGPIAWARWPNLKDRVLTYFINGGEPRHTDDKGDCRTPATPIMTTCQHYKATLFCAGPHPNVEGFSCDDPPNPRGYWNNTKLVHPDRQEQTTFCPWGCGPMKRSPWLDKTYVFHPAFTRWDRVRPRAEGNYGPPVSFVHNCLSWGCRALVEPARALGVQAYGGGNSPDGLVKHEDCFDILAKALCVVYLKSGGAVDYSILEAMAAGCPVTVHEAYLHHTRLYELLVPGETCLLWDSVETMRDCIERLKDPTVNRAIGWAGRDKLFKVLWNDPEGFTAFMRRMFP